MAKADSTPLTRERVTSAAIWVADRDGLDAVSMRRVGAELGVEAMSLYNHVRDKRDLLEGVLDSVLSGCADVPESGDPREDARRLARSVRSALLDHPNLAPLLATRPRETMGVPAVQAIGAKSFELAEALSVPNREIPYLVGATMSFVVGHVLLESGQFPTGEPVPSDGTYDADRSFDLGVQALLAGLVSTERT